MPSSTIRTEYLATRAVERAQIMARLTQEAVDAANAAAAIGRDMGRMLADLAAAEEATDFTRTQLDELAGWFMRVGEELERATYTQDPTLVDARDEAKSLLIGLKWALEPLTVA